MTSFEQRFNIAFTGGGTGGHIYPCFAVIEELISQNPSQKVYYIGNSNKLEAQLLTEDKVKDYREIPFKDYVKFLPIQAEPLIKSLNPITIIAWFMRFQKQINLAKKQLQENKISVVFGTGGYVSGPVFAACKALKIPYIIHNLDAFIGIANSVFVKNAYALTLGLESKQKIKPKTGKVIITGNPVSKKFLSAVIASSHTTLATGSAKQSSTNIGSKSDWIATSSVFTTFRRTPRNDEYTLLITGGSQGAEAINNAIGEILPELTKLNIQITHITGTKTYDDFLKKFLDSNPNKYSNYKVIAYTHEMPELCSQADLTVCRAGAMTIAEMSLTGVVPIFVPLPWAAHDHQNLNAATMVNAGAAISLDQSDKNFSEKLLKTIEDLVSNTHKLNSMQEKLKNFAKADAAAEIVELIFKSQADYVPKS